MGTEIEHLTLDELRGLILVNSEDEGPIVGSDALSGDEKTTIEVSEEPHHLILK